MSLAGQAVPFILSQPALSLSKLPSKLEFELQGLLTGASFFMAEKSRCFPPLSPPFLVAPGSHQPSLLTVDIKLHCKLIYMLFAPGFSCHHV